MKITTRQFLRSAGATVLALGCGISIAAAQPAIIVERGVMPAPRVEVIPVAPGAGYNWVPGHWRGADAGCGCRATIFAASSRPCRPKWSKWCRRGRPRFTIGSGATTSSKAAAGYGARASGCADPIQRPLTRRGQPHSRHQC